MAGRRTNFTMLVLVAGGVASGGLMYAVGSGWNWWLTLAHGVIGIGLVVMAPWKTIVAGRGLRRRGWAKALPSLALALLVVVAVVTGFVHRAGERDAGPLTVMQVHVGSALLAVPFAVWHVRTRPRRMWGADLDRRAVLRGGLLVGGSAAITLALPHASDRYTRSLERGSFDPAAMPTVQWFDDAVPRVDGGTWSLRVADREWSLEELADFPTETWSAVLDCTGGWYAEQRWSGVRLDRLLEASGAREGRSIRAVSLTGYDRHYPRGDADRLLVAIAVGDEPLSPGHGFPARLVAPGRRGFWWVKWLDRVELSDRPWWLQPPFPLT